MEGGGEGGGYKEKGGWLGAWGSGGEQGLREEGREEGVQEAEGVDQVGIQGVGPLSGGQRGHGASGMGGRVGGEDDECGETVRVCRTRAMTRRVREVGGEFIDRVGRCRWLTKPRID